MLTSDFITQSSEEMEIDEKKKKNENKSGKKKILVKNCGQLYLTADERWQCKQFEIMLMICYDK